MLTTGTKETLLIGVAHDQAELFGVLLKIRDMGLRLVSVTPVASAGAVASAEAATAAEAIKTAEEIVYT